MPVEATAVTRLQLSLGCGKYERTRALFDGTVRPQGVDLIPIDLRPSDIFWRQIKHGEFDVSEMSLSAHIMAVAGGDLRFVAIPVFPSRVFRHSSILVLAGSELSNLSQLRGRTIGVPEYHMTAALFVRGLLSDEYGIAPEEIAWVQAGLEVAGRAERVDLNLPASVDLRAEPNRTLTELLERRDVDALIAPSLPGRGPTGCIMPSLGMRRLLQDARAAEREYYEKTGIFPIMHTVVLRRELQDRHPWLATELMRCFSRAKEVAETEARTRGNLISALPWFQAELESTEKLMGTDFWPYGFEANAATLDAAVRYSFEQHLSHRRVQPAELFVDSCLAPSTT